MRWILKAAVQGTLSRMPGGERWIHWLRKHITGSLGGDELWHERKLNECRWHLDNYFSTCTERKFNVLELGSGWYPVMPLAFYLCGASKVWTVDIAPQLRIAAVRQTLRYCLNSAERGDLSKILPWLPEDRLSALKKVAAETCHMESASELLRHLNIEVLVQDARNLAGLNPSSVDFIFSNAVLEEIPEDILLGILVESKRIASPDALMSHYIGLFDYYSSSDTSISAVNFLRYSDRAWRLFTNSLHFNNRLRISDYRRLLKSAGFSILYEHDEYAPAEELEKIRLAERFRRYTRDDLLVIRSWVVATAGEKPLQRYGFAPGWQTKRRR